MLKKILIGVWVIIALVIFSIYYYFASIVDGSIGNLPDMEEIANLEYKFASQVYTADGVEMGTWSQSRENRIYADYDSISGNVINALIATEDIRFKEHSGIDAKSLLRAVVKNVIMGQENAGGGSTITQQLAKLLYTEVAGDKLERFSQKPIEWVIAVQLERLYTKEEILTFYLNKYDFGNNAVGIRSAAITYFGTTPDKLKIEEAATLVGMCKNSSLYNPMNPKRLKLTEERRNVVLMQMAKAGYITEAERDSLSKIPLKLNSKAVDHNTGIAPYFREYLRLYMTAQKPDKTKYHSWQMQEFYDDSVCWEQDPLYGWCNKNKKPNGKPYSIYTDGLKIYTTIDSRMQSYLEQAVHEYVVLDRQSKFFESKKGSKNAPFDKYLKEKDIEAILKRSMRNSERYRILKGKKWSDEKILENFNTPCEMKVFTYDGMKDTIMTPMDSIRYDKYYLRTGAVSMDPYTGAIKAYVGGTNFAQFKYDMAGVGRRQVGSTIKPFLYSMAMMHGFTPCDETMNVPTTIVTENGKKWSPRNSGDKKVGEMVTLKWGLQNSNNWISAYLISQMSPYSFKKLLHEYGLRNQEIEATPALCLGPCDASVLEMASGYTAFVAGGMRTAPLMVTRIEDSSGNVIASFSANKNEVISKDCSYKMIDMLKAVVDAGTGTRLRRGMTEDIVKKNEKGKVISKEKKVIFDKITAEMGGKTGTTQNNSDAWFIGITPSLVTACWVGGEDRSIHFEKMKDGQGAAMSLPIYGIYMNKVYADETLPYSQEEKFDIPQDFDPCAVFGQASTDSELDYYYDTENSEEDGEGDGEDESENEEDSFFY